MSTPVKPQYDQNGNLIETPGEQGFSGDWGAIAGNGMDFISQAMVAGQSMNMGTKDRMDEQGNVTHDVNVGAQAGSMAISGATLGGSIVPGWGHLIGGVAGGLYGGITGVIDADNQPELSDQLAVSGEYDLGNMVGRIQSESTLGVQPIMQAEQGLEVTDTKPIEVEKDELVLRKFGKMFKPVADFKGGKTHEMGGEPYVASEGDIIIPGKHRGKVLRALKNRRWSAIESIRQSLPTDTDGGMAKEGLNTGDPTKPAKKKRLDVYAYNPLISDDEKKLATLRKAGLATERDGKWYDTTFTSEFERGRKALESQYETVNYTPVYQPDKLPDLIRDNPTENIMMLDHSGKQLFGSQPAAIGNAFTDAGVKNCYNGTCHGEEFSNRVADNAANTTIYSTPYANSWKGFNTSKKGVDAIFPNGHVRYKGGQKIRYEMGTKEIKIGQYAEGTGEITTPTPYTAASDKIPKEEWVAKAVEAIKEEYPGISPRAIKNILGNLNMETPGGETVEGPWSESKLKSATGNYKSIGKNYKKWRNANPTVDYSNLSDDAKRSVMYFGDEDHEVAGGVGALQITAANYGGLKDRTDVIEKAFKELANPGQSAEEFFSDYKNSVRHSLRVYKNEGVDLDKIEKFKSPADLRRLINRYEDISSNSSDAKARRERLNVFEPDGKYADLYDTTETEYSKYADDVTARGGTPMSEEWYADNVTTKREENAKKIEQAKIDADEFNNNAESLGVYNNATPMGVKANAELRARLDAKDTRIRKKDEGMGDYLLDAISRMTPTSATGIPLRGADYKATEINTVGYTPDEKGQQMKAQVGKFYDWLEGGLSGKSGGDVGNAVMRGFHNVTAARDALMFGRSSDSSTLNRIGEIFAGENVEETNAILQEAAKQGILDDNGMKVIQNMIGNPENYQTAGQHTGFVTDVVSAVANIKGMVSLVKTGAKAGGTGTKAVVKAVRELMTSGGWKKLAKGSKAVYNKAVKGISSVLSETNQWDNIEDMKAVQKLLEESSTTVTNPTIAKETKSLSENFKAGIDFMKRMPGKISGTLKEQNPAKWKEYTKQMYTLTGKSGDELVGMNVGQVQKLINKNAVRVADELVQATEDSAAAWEKYGKVKNAVGSYKNEIAKLEKVVKKGPAWYDKMTDAKRNLDEGYQQLSAVEDNIRQVKEAEKLRKVNWDQIVKLEGVQDSKEFGDKFRVIQKTEEAIARNIKNLEKMEDIPEDISTFAKEQQQLSSTYAKNLKAYNENKALVGGAANAQNKLNSLKNVQDNVDKSVKFNRAKNLKNAQKLHGEVQAAKGRQAQFAQYMENYPEAMKAFTNDANLLRQFKNGTLQLPRLINVLRERNVDPKQIDEIAKTWEDLTPVKESEAVNPEGKKEDPNARPVAIGVDAPTKGITELEQKEPGAVVKDSPSEIPAGDSKPAIGSAIGKGVDMLSAYMPAIYNVMRGMETPDKIQRRFITPQTREYKNMSQPQMNAIDQAFEGAMSSARNLSGGMMANYRSNVEAAWAKKITDKSQVNNFEAKRADEIAAQNIQLRNQANQYNQQVNSKADAMDMQSEAATKSFLAQGMQDIGNISNMQRKDRNAEKMQEFTLGLMGTNNYKVVDGKIEFINNTVPTESSGTAVDEEITPTTTTPSIFDDMYNAIPPNPFK